MKRLVIGLDIDGVIVDIGYAMLPLLSKFCNRKIEYQDLCFWDLAKALNIDKKTVAVIWEQILESDLFRNAPPIKGAIEGLSAISKHEIWLITSRPWSTQDVTLSWLHDNMVHYDHIVFNRRGDKASAGPTFDVFVEDYIEEVYAIAEAGIFTILFDQPWNSTSTLPDNCKRALNWDDMLVLFDELAQI